MISHVGFIFADFLLTQRKGLLKEQLVAKDDGGRTVLHLAALSGDAGTLHAVVEVCGRGILVNSQVKLALHVWVR